MGGKKKPLSCRGCDKVLGKKHRLKCSGDCGLWYHGKAECTQLSEKELKKIIDNNKQFICNGCTDDKSSSSEDEHEESSNGDSTESETETTMRRTQSSNPSKKSPRKNSEYTIADVMKKLDDMREENRTLLEKFEKQEKETRKIRQRVEKMEAEQKTMRREIELLKNERQKQFESSLKNNVVIRGLPTSEIEEDELKKPVIKIAEKLKMSLNEEDIQCKLIGKEEKQLKVIFKDYSSKELLMKAKKNTSIKIKDCGFTGEAEVFINHDMSVECQKLFKKVRDYKKQNQFKYAWYAHGKIYLRKKDDSDVIHVKSEATLGTIKN